MSAATVLLTGATGFDNTRLIAEGMDAAPRFCDYLDVCVRTGERVPIAEQMLGDFR